jgi:hypothetical protein
MEEEAIAEELEVASVGEIISRHQRDGDFDPETMDHANVRRIARIRVLSIDYEVGEKKLPYDLVNYMVGRGVSVKYADEAFKEYSSTGYWSDGAGCSWGAKKAPMGD